MSRTASKLSEQTCESADNSFSKNKKSTREVLNVLPGDDEGVHEFASVFTSFVAEPDVPQIDFDLICPWLGFQTAECAVRLFKKTFEEHEYVIVDRPPNRVSRRETRSCSKEKFLVSLDQFEEIAMVAQTADGKRARKYILALKTAAMKVDKNRLLNLQQQLSNYRAAQFYLYAFWLFDDRYKCGITQDVEKREKQHRTSCPSGKMVHFVKVNSKYMEKVMDTVMKKKHLSVRQEEYEIHGGEETVKLILNTFSRAEEVLINTDIEHYDKILTGLEKIFSSLDPLDPAIPKAFDPFLYFAKEHIVHDMRGRFTFKEARDMWKRKAVGSGASDNDSCIPTDMDTLFDTTVPTQVELKRFLESHFKTKCGVEKNTLIGYSLVD
jgi:phage anti-repressor protein/predicted GIY-YIG superfamily endonuclease